MLRYTSRPASKRCCSTELNGVTGFAAPGFPGHSILDSTLAARDASSSDPPASVAKATGSRTIWSLGPPRPRPLPAPRPPGPPPRPVDVVGAGSRASSKAYAPPGPARPPGQLGQGAPGVAAAVAVIDGAAPRRAAPGIGVFGTSATSAPRSTADRCQAGRAASATIANVVWIDAS